MRKLALLITVLLLATSSCQDEIADPGGIVGNVTDGTQGVEEVKVELFTNSRVTQQTLTGPGGNFQFNDVIPGDKRLTFSKSGFDDQSQTVTVVSGQIENINVNILQQAGSIAGIATDQNGISIEGATVELIQDFTTQNTSTTDATGSFGFDNLPLGRYQVQISKENFESADQIVTVARDQVTLANFSLKKLLGSLKITVIDNFDSELEDFSYEIIENTQVLFSGNVFGESSFEIEEMPVGVFEVAIDKTGFNTGIKNVEVETDLLSDEEIKMSPESLPSGGVLSSSTTSFTATSATFTLDIFVVDDNSNEISSLSATNFDIADGEFSAGNNFDFTLTSVTQEQQTSNGPYSAALLIDQSGSISSTDPNHSRLQGAKIFLDALGVSDNANLSAFSSGGTIPQDPLTIFGPFTNDGSSFFNNVDQLAQQVSGGTPLYSTTNDMVDYTFNNATNSNRAVIVFTDGEDTSGGVSIDQLVSNAVSKGVKIFTVGLSNGTDTKVLGEMAGNTGGAFLLASDARQLVSMYGTLGNILSGSSAYYRTQWTVNTTQTSFPGWFTTSMVIDTPQGQVNVPLYVEAGGQGGVSSIAVGIGNSNNTRVLYSDY